MTLQKHRYALAALLLAVSLLAVAPTITRADQQNQNGTITINATGQATPIDKKATGGPATLSLTGNVHTEGNDPLKIKGLTGNLQVGGTTYPISDGQGEANKKGSIQIDAKSNGNGKHNYELILHGNMQGNSLTFDSHESKLSSMFFLSLSGQANVSINQNSSSSKSENESETENESHSGSTVTQTVTVTQNNNATTTVFSNQTVTQTVNNGTTTTAFNNKTVTQTITQPQNITITTTQFNNQTITFALTNTVANSTITQTATTTVANTTLTQTTTTTVANTTITVTTNATTPPP